MNYTHLRQNDLLRVRQEQFRGILQTLGFCSSDLKMYTRIPLEHTNGTGKFLMRSTRLKINFTKFLTSLNFKRQRKKKYRRPKTLQLPIRSSLQLSQLSQVVVAVVAMIYQQATTRVVQVQATLKAFLLATRRQVARQVTTCRRRRVLQLTRQEFKWPRQRRQIDL